MRIFNEWGPLAKPSVGQAPCSPHVFGMCRGKHEDEMRHAEIADDVAHQLRICDKCWQDHGGNARLNKPARGWVEGGL